MFTIFKYIDYAMKAKQGYHAPDELIADTSFGLIEGFFILSFIILGFLSGGLLYAGFTFGYVLLKIFGFLFLGILFFDIMIYRFIKKSVTRISKKMTDSVQGKIKDYRTIDVDAREINHE